MELLKPSHWVPKGEARWSPLIHAVLREFLGKFEPALLQELLEDQFALPTRCLPGARAVALASKCTAFHKVCQILARSPLIPKESRDLLVPLENLPPSAIPEAARLAARNTAAEHLKIKRSEVICEKIGRGSVADVFKIQSENPPKRIALKTLRADSGPRVRREAEILYQLAEECDDIATLVGPDFARSLADAIKEAARGLLREIDFAGESRHLKAAQLLYSENEAIRVPRDIGAKLENGIFMEFVNGFPLLENSLSQSERRNIARLLFRSVILEPLFSGQREAVFHGDPHAGNIRLAAGAQPGDYKVILLDWSQAGYLSKSLAQALVELCLACYDGRKPSPEMIGRVLESKLTPQRIPVPVGDNPLEQALEIIQLLAIEGSKVPSDLLLLRKSMLTLEGISLQLDPDFNPWRETLAYFGWVLASELPFRLLSASFPCLDSPSALRSGISTSALLARASDYFVHLHNFGLTQTRSLCDSLARQEEGTEDAASGFLENIPKGTQ